MPKKIILGLIFIFFLNFHISFADGFIIPHPHPDISNPLDFSVKYHRVEIKVKDQVCVTEIDQVFINENNRDLEGTYIFPLPENSAISEFSMDVDGKMLKGKILDKAEARRIYEEIVRRKKDPAILEYLGRNIFQAKIYPIPAKGEKHIKLKYNELIKVEEGLGKIVYPLSTEKFSLKPLNELVITINIHSSIPIKSIYSPTHDLSFRRIDDYNLKASFEQSKVKPDKDLIIYYTLSNKDFGVNLISYRENLKNPGYFLLLVAPKEKFSQEEVLSKEIVFVLDTSGSMADEDKIFYAKRALNFCLANLDKKDYFNLINFNDEVELFSKENLIAAPLNINKAKNFIQDLKPSGGTNINQALIKALELFSKNSYPKYLIFLTDGLPTVGITSVNQILEDLKQKNKNTHLFTFGVGYDVNTNLLDQLGSQNHGIAEYVKGKEEIEQKLSSFYRKISRPVMTNLKLDFQGIKASMLYPKEISDLFSGTQLVLLGRYEGSGETKITLSGKRGNSLENFEYPVNFAKFNQENNYIAHLWAIRRIGYLIETLKTKGENKELINEIIDLSKKYGIITPLPKEINKADICLGGHFSDKEKAKRVIAGKTFYLKKGIWTENGYQDEKITRIKFLSPEYFKFLKENPNSGKILSLGSQIIFNWEGKFYQVYIKN
ncbi:MAG: VWA domain-containing protein [Armatimonadetes bacterium]|nr:VWA domain-containing protein [Armatimonadota bacterium]